ncbi:MAG: hypothetical protein HC890_19470 [Chloroflexaceae bacterium]|nr:hypothetical protein [Chloroflexaceae bacterium]
MYLPLPQLASSDTLIWGDVRIHPEAIVAPGTILQALANYRITIGAGACISSGAILKASAGNIDIGEGAVLGMGVLIVGRATIGHHACIGAATTILQADIPPHTAIAAAALLGDPTRQIATESQNGLGAAEVEPARVAAEESPTAAEIRAEHQNPRG